VVVSAAKHTPGPWRVGPRYGANKLELNAPNGDAIATVWAFRPKMVQREGSPDRSDYVEDAEGHANACLIAAAPALADALVAIIEDFDNDNPKKDFGLLIDAGRIALRAARRRP
jgi:hypothetical protein